MRRRDSLAARLAPVFGLLALTGGCHVPTTESRQPLAQVMKPASVTVDPPAGAGPAVRQSLYAPGTLVPLVPSVGASPAPAAGRLGIARGASPTTPDRSAFQAMSSATTGLRGRPEDVLPPPESLVPDIARLPAPTVTTERSDSADGPPGPNWVAVVDVRGAKTLAPSLSLVRDDELVALKPPPSGELVDAPKPTPPSAQVVPAPSPPTSPALPPLDPKGAGAASPRVLRVKGPIADDGVVHVSGVAIPIPAEALGRGPVRPALATLPPIPREPLTAEPPRMLPPITGQSAAPPAPVTTEPPIRPAETPQALPPIGEPPAPPPAPPGPPPPPPSAPLLAPPAKLPPLPAPPPVVPAVPAVPLPIPAEPTPGPIDVGGSPLPFESLSQLIDGGAGGLGGGCSSCGGSCGGGQCAAGHKPCEPFPARTCLGRVIGLVYENICCPNPCYQPRWEPITAAAFFTDAPRPITQTRFRWDYGSNLSFPDRGEMFWPRADGNGRGPKPTAPARGVPALAYHELYLDQEIAAGPASVTISMPYRSVNPFPYAPSAAGFSDLQITAKSLLFDSELFLFAFQMRTYIPTGNASKGLGTGHTSLEPGLIAGVRVSPATYAIAQVQEWIPLGGDSTYAGAALLYSFAFNHVLWQPVKNVQLIGTWEMTGLSFQDGAYTDPLFGSGQKLSGQTSLAMGAGARLYFCDKFDLGAGWDHQIAGRFLPMDQLRVECRYRY